MDPEIKRAVVFFALVAICVSGISQTMAQDWPQWRGPHRDGKVKGFTAPKTWPKELTQKWKTTVGSGNATPALVGDKLYVFARQGGDEVIMCLNADNGKELWRDKYKAPNVTGAASRHPGPRSSPTVAGGKVITLGVVGILSCMDVSTGKLSWYKDPYPNDIPKFFTAMSPIVVDGMVIAQLGGAGNGAVIAYDLATGNEKWKWDQAGPDYGSPALLEVAGSRQIATPTENSIVGIDITDGKLLWQIPCVPQRMSYNAATPIIDGATMFYNQAGEGIKAVTIEKDSGGFAVRELWTNPDLSLQFNTPVLKDGFLYGVSNRGNIFCINAKTGETAWKDEESYGRGFGAIVDAGSVLLALTSTSELIVLKPDGKKYNEVTRYKVSQTETYAHPVISGNSIFIKDGDSVTCFDLSG